MEQTSKPAPAAGNEQQRLERLDFIKGVAIIFVILNHAGIKKSHYYNFWNGQAVPLFIIVSCLLGYLALSRNSSIKNYFSKEKVKRTLIRIFLPFVAAQLVLVLTYIAAGGLSIKSFFTSGGIGPGSYYPWLYLQLWVAIPFMFFLMKKNIVIGLTFPPK